MNSCNMKIFVAKMTSVKPFEVQNETPTNSAMRPVPEIIKLFSYSIQVIQKFIMLINVKNQTIAR